MLKELFDALAEKAEKGMRPEVVAIPGEAPHVIHLAMPDGSVHEFTTNAMPRKNRAASLATIIKFAKDYSHACEVWYSRHEVLVYLDRGARRDLVQLKLTPSPQLEVLKLLESSRTWYLQRDFLTLLRITFRDCLGLCGNIIEVLRRVKFLQKAAGDSEIQQGKQSVGKTLMNELTGAGTIPESLNLTVPVFAGGLIVWAKIECALEVEPANEKFCLIPFPGEIERVFLLGEETIHKTLAEALEENDVTIYHGQP